MCSCSFELLLFRICYQDTIFQLHNHFRIHHLKMGGVQGQRNAYVDNANRKIAKSSKVLLRIYSLWKSNVIFGHYYNLITLYHYLENIYYSCSLYASRKMSTEKKNPFKRYQALNDATSG